MSSYEHDRKCRRDERAWHERKSSSLRGSSETESKYSRDPQRPSPRQSDNYQSSHGIHYDEHDERVGKRGPQTRNDYRTTRQSKNEDEAKRREGDFSIVKEEPNFEVSGVLAEDQNQRNGIPLIFSVSADSALPDEAVCDWRIFEFLGDSNPRSVKLSGSSCFLFGGEKRLAGDQSEDIQFVEIEHPSCSRQHAVIQFRNRGGIVKPYVMDLNSSNKTYLNDSPLEPGRYVELRNQDILTFGKSDSEFVIMNAYSDAA